MNKALAIASIIVGAGCFSVKAATGSLVLTGATVHTISHGTLATANVVIHEGRIAAIEPGATAASAKAIDLSGHHLYPGLIASGTLLGLLEIDAVRATDDSREVGLFRPDVESWIAVNPDSELIAVARANGITHVLPVPMGGVVSGQSGLVVLHGWTTEQMLAKPAAALHLFWPSMSLDTRPKEALPKNARFRSLEEQARDREARLEEIHRFFAEAKAYSLARAGAPAGPATSSVPAWDAMLPFIRGEMPLMIHADELRQIESAVHWAGTNGFKTIIAGGRDAALAADLLAAKKIPVLFEHVFTLPAKDDLPYDVYYRTPADLRRAGVRVLLGEGLDSSAASTLRNLPYSAAQSVAFGLDKNEALAAITLYPAELLGVAESLGSLEAGKAATLFATDGDLFDIRANVKRMWIDGVEVDLASRHTRLFDKYRQRPPSRPKEPNPR